MSVTAADIEKIQGLASAASSLEIVTNGGQAINAILNSILAIAADKIAPVNEQPALLSVDKRIELAGDDVRVLFGLLKELSAKPETSIGDLRKVSQRLGYTNIVIGLA